MSWGLKVWGRYVRCIVDVWKRVGSVRTDVARRWCNAEDIVKGLYKYIPTFYLQKYF